MSWRKTKIGNFLIRSKIPIDIEDNKDYKRVTIRINHNGVSLRDIEKGINIGTKKQFILKAGQFILSKIDARYGAFGIAPVEVDGAIITGNFWAYDFDKSKINIAWLNQYTNSPEFYDICERASSGITHRKYLNEEKFLDHEVFLPDADEQRMVIANVDAQKTTFGYLSNEIANQQGLLKQLRQSFLKEAMQGKLAKQVKKEGNAKELLQIIKLENEKLIAEKKIKKTKAFPPIREQEIPFEIPENWTWCRLGEICKVKVGSTPRREVSQFWNGNIPWVSSGEVANNFIYNTREKITQEGFNNTSLVIYPKGSVLVAMIGQGRTRGQTSILKIDSTTNQNVAGLIIEHQHLLSEFLWFFFLSRYETTRGGASGGNQPALNGIKISNTLFPLPPFEEQKRIVKKLEEVMSLCDELKTTISDNQNYTSMLLQAALKDVLQPQEVEA